MALPPQQVSIPLGDAEAARPRIELYKVNRARLGLPRLKDESLKTGLRLTFLDTPPPLDPPETPREAYLALLGWLLELEDVWGPLGQRLCCAEVGVDLKRTRFTVGPGLFVEPDEPDLLDHLWNALGSTAEPLPQVATFSELAAHAAAADPTVGALLEKTGRSGALLRSLGETAREAQEAGRYEHARRLWDHALVLSPGSRDSLRGTIRARLSLDARLVSPPLLSQLESYSPLVLDDALLAAEVRLAHGQREQALAWARRSTEMAPRSIPSWKLVARCAQGGPTELVYESLTELAALGVRPALSILAQAGEQSDAFRTALERFQGELDPELWSWRVGRLLAEERLGGALQLATSHAAWLPALSSDRLSNLIAAARRHASRGPTGAIPELARVLRRSQREHPLHDAITRALAECLHILGRPEELLELAEQHPGAVPPLLVLESLLRTRDWNSLLKASQAGNLDALEAAWYCLVALAHLSIGGAHPRGTAVADLVLLLERSGRRDDLHSLARTLGRIAPRAPVVEEMTEALDAMNRGR